MGMNFRAILIPTDRWLFGKVYEILI